MHYITAEKAQHKLHNPQSLCITTVILTCILMNSADAASRGEFATKSSATIQISITINQTFLAVSSPELLLSQDKLSINAKKPFCIGHHGFSQDASVPYDLVVDEMRYQNPNTDGSQSLPPYYIYYNDKNSHNKKQQLSEGMILSQQSNIYISENLPNDCENSGIQLSIEENSNTNISLPASNSIGILRLLISPT